VPLATHKHRCIAVFRNLATWQLLDQFVLELETPAGFPDRYREAVVNAMNLRAVKKHLSQPPSFEITTVAN
jgi:hypothetical protein